MAEPEYASDACLLDISWSLYCVNDLAWPSRDIRDTNAFGAPARNLDSILHRTSIGGAEYDEEDSDRAGGFHRSSWELIRSDSVRKNTVRGVLVTVEYDRSSYKAVLLLQPNTRQRATAGSRGPRISLLLLRMPTTLSRRFIKFLETEMSPSTTVTVRPLKLPTSLLCSMLESYINTLSTLPSAQALPSYSKDTALQDLPTQMLRDVRISLSFLGPVAPHLRSLDLDIPYETAWKLIKPGVEEDYDRSEGTGFLQRLAGHIDRTMGLKLPWRTQNKGEGKEDEELIRISRITCASLVVAADGKVKLVGKFADGINDDEMLGLIAKANNELVDALVKRAVTEIDQG